MLRCLALLLSLAVPAASAQVYKWVDEKGRVHYGEQPPRGAKASAVKPPAGPSTPAKPLDLQSQELDFRRRQIKQREDEAEQAREAADREERCNTAKQNLAIADQSGLYRRDQGARVFLSDAERQTEIEKNRAEVTRHCR